MKTNVGTCDRMEERKVPIISMFAGMKVFMRIDDHNPPHIHVSGQKGEAVVDIRTGDVISGSLQVKQYKKIRRWVELHQEELLYMWENREIWRVTPL